DGKLHGQRMTTLCHTRLHGGGVASRTGPRYGARCYRTQPRNPLSPRLAENHPPGRRPLRNCTIRRRRLGLNPPRAHREHVVKFLEKKMTGVPSTRGPMFLVTAALIFGQARSPVQLKAAEEPASCNLASLPSDIQSRLKKAFSSWKIQEPETLNEHATTTWTGRTR